MQKELRSEAYSGPGVFTLCFKNREVVHTQAEPEVSKAACSHDAGCTPLPFCPLLPPFATPHGHTTALKGPHPRPAEAESALKKIPRAFLLPWKFEKCYPRPRKCILPQQLPRGEGS